jgi:hypothetical protein
MSLTTHDGSMQTGVQRGACMKRPPSLASPAVLLLSLLMLMTRSCVNHGDNPVSGGGGVSVGILTVTPDAIIQSSVTNISLCLTVPGNLRLADSKAKILRLNGNGAQAQFLGYVYDDGLAGHQDEIKNDNIYNTTIEVAELGTGPVRVQASGTTDGGDILTSPVVTLNVYPNISTVEYRAVIVTQDSAAARLSELLAGNPGRAANAVAQLKSWLLSKPEVQSVGLTGSTSISIQYASGLYGGIFISQAGPMGTVQTRGGFLHSARRRTRKIARSKQTTGTAGVAAARSTISSNQLNLDPAIIGNRNVLIFAPFETEFAPYNEGQRIQATLTSSGFRFNVTYCANQGATVAALSSMTSYGLVVLATHGSEGKSFATGETVDTNSTLFRGSYKAMIRSGKLAIWKNLTISSTGVVRATGDIYVVRPPFISSLKGTFPNSVIINNSCESSSTLDLQNAFVAKGAKTYYGYSGVVNSEFCVVNTDTLTKRLAIDLTTSGDAFTGGKDPISPYAIYEMAGSSNLHYPDSLINGDFETGTMEGWTTSGGGCAISRLGNLEPAGGNTMGIVSSGLGRATATDTMYQTFTIKSGQSTLALTWNFLSEEFLEYIGQGYPDYFQVILKEAAGAETILLNETVDALAREFGASRENAGSLIRVSPEVTFDDGDVYMTGWQTTSFNISEFAGKRVTLVLRAGSAGDTMFDSAILIDNISIE